MLNYCEFIDSPSMHIAGIARLTCSLSSQGLPSRDTVGHYEALCIRNHFLNSHINVVRDRTGYNPDRMDDWGGSTPHLPVDTILDSILQNLTLRST